MVNKQSRLSAVDGILRRYSRNATITQITCNMNSVILEFLGTPYVAYEFQPLKIGLQSIWLIAQLYTYFADRYSYKQLVDQHLVLSTVWLYAQEPFAFHFFVQASLSGFSYYYSLFCINRNDLYELHLKQDSFSCSVQILILVNQNTDGEWCKDHWLKQQQIFLHLMGR